MSGAPADGETVAGPAGFAVVVRPMTAADLDLVVVLDSASFPWTRWSRDAFEAELRQVPGARWYAVAHLPGSPSSVLGQIGLMAALSGSGPADVTTLAVAPAARRRGVASALLTAALGEARARGADTLVLEVAATNGAALALYARHRFAVLGTRRGYYAGPDGAGTVDAVVLSRPVGPADGS